MRSRLLALCVAVLVGLGLGPFARADAAPGGGPHIHIRPVVEAAGPGAPFRLALDSTPEPGWHGYWGENPGDAGFPPKFEWTLPPGMSVGAWRWPAPTTLKIAGLMNYVYGRPFAPVVTMTPGSGGRGPIQLHMSYLVCTAALCVPEDQSFTIDASSVEPGFDRYEAALPRPLGGAATYAAANGQVRLAIPYPAAAPLADAYFFPKTIGAIDYAAPQTVTRDGDRLLIETRGKASGAIEGVLRIADGRGLIVHATPGAVPEASAPDTGWGAALLAFAGALIGGLILNVMPCVFPILSLKALSLARSGASTAHARSEALAYTAGVVLVCVALGAAMLLLKAGGSSVGWAFQLQNPRVVLLLALLTVGIALNLTGLFELPTPQVGGMGGANAFATGALAAVIATPCSGPFMAAAMGTALLLPWYAALAVFAGLGIGLALPFIAIGFVPGLRARLPRPGAWMATTRRFLSVPMFLTAIALGWVLGKEAGADGLTIALLGALGVALALWTAGRRQARGLSFGLANVAVLVMVALLAAERVGHARAPAAATAATGAQSFTESRLAALRAANRPVFAYFTADWCLTCKVNERVAIDTQAVRAAFAVHHVAVLEGDWTNGDPALGRFIEAHNRAGVPLYLFFPPGGGEAKVLPQVLTPSMLEALAT